MRARILALAVTLVLGGALAACDAGTVPGSSPTTGSRHDPADRLDRSQPAAAAPSAAPAPLVVDPGLLGILPTSVAGVAMQPGAGAAADMIKDASLAQSASALAVGTVAAGNASSGGDFATATVVQLRPGVYSDAFYGDWRAAYDTAACAPAGGVSSHIQQLVGQHAVEVTVCGAGARTYHAHLGGDILVSITAVGDRRFGGLVMAGSRR